jgi:hypothetical protein
MGLIFIYCFQIFALSIMGDFIKNWDFNDYSDIGFS